jgi:hypothetical protein
VVVLDAAGWRRPRELVAVSCRGGGPVTAAAAGPAACPCELGGARRHPERAIAELEQARLAWGVWADGVRKLAQQRTGVSVADGFGLPGDRDYARALRMGAWFDDAASLARRGWLWKWPEAVLPLCSRSASACPLNGNRFTSSLIAPRLRER